MGNMMDEIYPDAVVLGIDLSLNGTGIALLELYENEINIVDTFYIDLSGYKRMGLKLELLWGDLVQIFDIATTYANENHCKLLVCKERPFISSKYGSVEKLYMTHGVLELALWDNGLDIVTKVYSASTIKKTVGGAGNVSKEQVAKGIPRFMMFPVELYYNDDITDAIACGITHLIKEGLMEWKSIT